MSSAKLNKRLGIKVPRSTLLPPYMSVNQYFVDYTDSMDAVFGANVDQKIDAIVNIRNMWVQSPATENKAQLGELIKTSDWTVPERDILVKQVNMLGMRLKNAGVVSDDAYQTIARFVGEYWFSKGTQGFIEFISFCLGIDIRVYNLWTQDYTNFKREGDSSIGAPVWEGGPWYPTTHVELGLKSFTNIDLATLQSFFYEIANFNLVLQGITTEFDMYIVDRIEEDHITAQVMSVGLWADNSAVIANFRGFGAPPPDSHFLANGEQLPATYYSGTGAPANFNQAFILAKPSGWMLLEDGKRVPVYGQAYRNPVNGPNLGTELVGGAGPQYNLIYGPVEWVKPPGSPRSTSRIPGFTTGSPTIIDANQEISAQTVGTRRTGFLVNPVGWTDQIQSGVFVPYW